MAAPIATEAHPGLIPRTLDTLHERLAEVKKVGFELLMELSEAVSSVA